MFAQLEQRMASELYYWQNVRGHLSLDSIAAELASGDLQTLLDAVSKSALFKPPDLVLDLR